METSKPIEVPRFAWRKAFRTSKSRQIHAILNYFVHFGVGINGISSNTKRCDEKLLTNKEFRKQLQEIDGLLHENTKTKV